MLYNILQELKILYANHAPQLKPRSSQMTGVVKSTSLSSASSSSEQLTSCDSPEGYGNAENNEIIDLLTDVYNILEGSSLIPFAEVGSYGFCRIAVWIQFFPEWEFLYWNMKLCFILFVAFGVIGSVDIFELTVILW